MNSPASLHRRATGFTLTELLTVIAIIMALAAIVLPMLSVAQRHSGSIQAMNVMKQLGAETLNYANQNGNALPEEGSASQNGWSYAANPANGNCWFNALPRLLGKKGTGDFVTKPENFYTKENMLFLPAAEYPEGRARLAKPLYAFAMNSKLERKTLQTPQGSVPLSGPVLLSNIAVQSKTVLFLERGLPSERRAVVTYPRVPSYDGAPKADFQAFVGRYSNRGVVTFVDGHAESFAPEDLILVPSGRAVWSPTDVHRNRVIWCKTEEEDPN